MPRVKFVGKASRIVADRYMHEDEVRDLTAAQAEALRGDKDFVFVDEEPQKKEQAAEVLEVVTGEADEPEAGLDWTGTDTQLTRPTDATRAPDPRKTEAGKTRAKSTRKK